MKSITNNQFLQIKDNKSWIQLHDKILYHNTVNIVNCKNIRLAGPYQFNAKNVFLQSCDTVFQRWWLDTYHFPYIKNIYIDGEYEPIAYNRFDHGVSIFITEDMISRIKPYFIEGDCICLGNRYIKVITKEYMNCILNKLQNTHE